MGQAPAKGAKEGMPGSVGFVHGKLQKHAVELKQLATLSYEKFLASLKELNEITCSFSDLGGKKLIFQLKSGTDTTVFWKGTVKIRCHKVSSRSGAIESTRVLNLKDYVRLYNEITQQASLANLQPGEMMPNLSASIILTEFENQREDDHDNECCICMDRKAEVILSCSHTYCETCIDEWNVNHKTCPICRAAVQGKDDTWVLTEKPDSSEMAYETTGYLLGLADRTGSPAHSSGD